MIVVADWLRSCGLDHLVDLFAHNEIDGEVLVDLTESDLKELGLSLGVRKKLLKAIAKLETEARTSSTGEKDAHPVADPPPRPWPSGGS